MEPDISLTLGFQGSGDFERRLRRAESQLDRLGNRGSQQVDKLTRRLTQLAAGFVGFRAIRGFITGSISAFDQQEKAVRKVEQAIVSTGMAAGLSLKTLQKEAAELQKNTLFGDETILNQATAQLLTFTNIANEEFLRTQKVALDLSTVLGTDLQSSSIQLGKALNDPVANLSALSRSGIQFSKAQKEVIKELATTNRLAEAQGVILNELERQYGGQAEAAVTGAGAIQQFGNTVGDLAEKIGGFLVPIISDFTNALSPLVTGLTSLFSANEDVTDSYTKQIGELRVTQVSLNSLTKRLNDTTLSERDQETIVKEINRIYPEFAKNIDITTASQQDLSKALDDANKSIDRQIQLLTFQAGQAKLTEQFNEAIANQANAIVPLTRFLGELDEQYQEIAENSGPDSNLARSFKLFKDQIQTNEFQSKSFQEQIDFLGAAFEGLGDKIDLTDFAQVRDRFEELRIQYEDGKEGIEIYGSALDNLREIAQQSGFSLNELDGVTEKLTKTVAKASGPAPGSVDAFSKRLSAAQKALSATAQNTDEWERAIVRVRDATIDLNLAKLNEDIKRVNGQISSFVIEGAEDIIAANEKIVESFRKTTGLIRDSADLPSRTLPDLVDEDQAQREEAALQKRLSAMRQFNADMQDLGKQLQGAFLQAGIAIAEDLGKAIGAGEDIAAAFEKVIKDLIVQVPKIIGLTLIQSALTPQAIATFPANLGLIAAGLALIGASGLLSGLLPTEELGDIAAASSTAPTGSAGAPVGAAPGLGAAAQDGRETPTIIVQLDGQTLENAAVSVFEDSRQRTVR